MKKKGNAFKRKKQVIRTPKQRVTSRYGAIAKKKHFCVLCWVINEIKNLRILTVHHIIEQKVTKINANWNKMVLCEDHHMKIHHPFMYEKIKKVYEALPQVIEAKAKFNKMRNP